MPVLPKGACKLGGYILPTEICLNRFVAVFIALCLGTVAFRADASATTASIRVEPAVTTGPVKRNVLGNNVYIRGVNFEDAVSNRGGGIWDPIAGRPAPEYATLAKQAGISVLRWPGGEVSRHLDWKTTVGLLSRRPQQRFGLPEFLTFCAAIGAQPIITISAGVGSEADAADLVEYLNAPANGGNPNGGVDWAAVRSADGHKEPWNVVWFEYGNEEFNTPRTPDEYVTKYQAYQSKMKSVDPKIKLGAVFLDSTNVDDGWTYTVLQRIGKQIDFGVIHPYMPKLDERAAKQIPKDIVAQSAVASDADLVYRLGLYRELANRVARRSDLPLAVTEYNGNFTQELPVPYRQTLVNALHNADFVRIFLKPESNVTLATFWLFANSYWGMVTGYAHQGMDLVKQANFYVYQIYNAYLYDDLVKMDIQSKPFEFSGGIGISPRIGTPSTRRSMGVQTLQGWSRRLFMDGTQSESGNIVSVDFDKNADVNYYHATREIEVEPDTLYKISVKARTINLKGGKIGIAVEDIRGWDKTFYQPNNFYLSGTTPWSWVTVEFRTLADAKTIRVMARRIKGGGIVSGRAEFGEIRVEKIKQEFGAVESVVGTASKSAKGDELGLVLINKNLYEPVETTIQIAGNYHVIKAEALSGPSPFATNLEPGQSNAVKISSLTAEQNKTGTVTIQLPAASVTGIRFKRN